MVSVVRNLVRNWISFVVVASPWLVTGNNNIGVQGTDVVLRVCRFHSASLTAFFVQLIVQHVDVTLLLQVRLSTLSSTVSAMEMVMLHCVIFEIRLQFFHAFVTHDKNDQQTA